MYDNKQLSYYDENYGHPFAVNGNNHLLYIS